MATPVSDRSVERSMEALTDAGAFGPDAVRFVSFALDGRHAGRDQYASTVLYGTLTVRGESGVRTHRLVIKTKHAEPELRRLFKSDSQFGNETLFYERIVPYLTAAVPADRRPRFCRCFNGRADGGGGGGGDDDDDRARLRRDMIVLENETSRGYRSARSDHPVFLDYDHVAVALRTLAKYHALSYTAKGANRSKFKEMIETIAETQWTADGGWVMSGDGIQKALSLALDRLAARARGGGDGGVDDEMLRRFRAGLLLPDAKRNLKRAMEPVEPLAVLCHGDFNRNNLMFRYDDRGKPVDALPFDMATVRYGSPALDLSFFLYMNTDRRLRDARWDAMLDEYCAALAAAVSGPAGAETVPGRAQIDAEMRDHAFSGLTYASFFLRAMMEKHVFPDNLEYARMDDDERVRFVLPLGGDEAADAVADVVQHYIDVVRTRCCSNGSSRGGAKI